MEPSSLIFVALAVAWAVYLGPKLFAHHDEGLRSRTVSTFSRSLRVLARREASAKGTTNLVRQAPREPKRGTQPGPTKGRPSEEPVYVEVAPRLTPNQIRARRAIAKRATRRRRNVLALLLLAIAAVVVLAVMEIVDRIWVGAPVVLLLAWLVTCRVMVRKERSVATVRVPAVSAGEPLPAYEIDEQTGEIRAVYDEPAAESVDHGAEAAAAAAGRWDPVEPPLPTYVSKPAAPRRTVRTIDLDSTGVWSSGRNASDSALAREAEQAERTAKREAKHDVERARRASGS